jgi:transposase-like protein
MRAPVAGLRVGVALGPPREVFPRPRRRAGHDWRLRWFVPPTLTVWRLRAGRSPRRPACLLIATASVVPAPPDGRTPRQAEIDGGLRPGVTTQEQQRIAELERENRELRRGNEILKAASAYFAAELDRPRTR